jgi:glycosyltransferase involved in cell wall biosynthesis
LHVSAYFAPAFRYGGPPRSILGLCRALRGADVDVHVLTTTANGVDDLPPSPDGGETYEGIPVRRLPRRFPRRFFGCGGMRATLRSYLHTFDLVHLHGLWNLPVWTAARAARRAGVPYFISPRGMLNPQAVGIRAWRKRLFYQLLERRNLASAAFLHATSSAEAAALAALRLDVPIVTLGNGVDLPEDRPEGGGAFRRQRGIPAEAPIIAFLGRIHAIKRLDLLADAFLKLTRESAGARLVLAGPFEQPEYQRAIARRLESVGQDVLWTGELDQAAKWALLRDTDALVICSDQESFGMSIAEGLAAGVPVIATQTCPWPELETHDCGWWVDHSVDGIAKAMSAVVADRRRAAGMGERGRELVRERFAWSAVAAAMKNEYAKHVRRDSGSDSRTYVNRPERRILPRAIQR